MRFLCIGDSNTWGYNPEDGMRHKNRWTRVLADKMPEHQVIEEGLNGRTILSVDTFMPERRGISGLKMMLMTHKPVDWVILMLGTNELKNVFECTAEYIAAGIEEFLKVILDDTLWDRFQVPEVLVVSPILIREELITNGDVFGEFDEKSVAESRKVAAALKEVCDRYQVDFLDGADYAEASLLDNIHMDEENHIKLAEGIYAKLMEIISA